MLCVFRSRMQMCCTSSIHWCQPLLNKYILCECYSYTWNKLHDGYMQYKTLNPVTVTPNSCTVGNNTPLNLSYRNSRIWDYTAFLLFTAVKNMLNTLIFLNVLITNGRVELCCYVIVLVRNFLFRSVQQWELVEKLTLYVRRQQQRQRQRQHLCVFRLSVRRRYHCASTGMPA
jgi:hypothetical protein